MSIDVEVLANLAKSIYTWIDNRIYFATGNAGSSPFLLLFHDTFSSSSTEYVKVKGDKSPFDGDLIN